MGSFEGESIIEAAKIVIKLFETAEIAWRISFTTPLRFGEIPTHLSNVKLPVNGLHSFVKVMM
jgi:hypothetical protein